MTTCPACSSSWNDGRWQRRVAVTRRCYFKKSISASLFTRQSRHPRGHFNRLIERKLVELGGIKSLYSDSFYEPEEFWGSFDKPAYDRLKARYDPKGRLSDLYRKCVLRE